MTTPEGDWLIERRTTPPQWSTESAPFGVGAFYSDVHRAYRFPTKAHALGAMQRMRVTPKERAEYFVSEHVFGIEPGRADADEYARDQAADAKREEQTLGRSARPTKQPHSVGGA